MKLLGSVLLVVVFLGAFFGLYKVNPKVHQFVQRLTVSDPQANEEREVVGSITGENPRIKEIQETLQLLKYKVGTADGMFSKQVREAIAEFQKDKGLLSTGYVDSKTWTAFTKERARFQESSDRNLKGGKHMFADEEKIKKTQVILQLRGLYKGEVDGKMKLSFKKALIEFQEKSGLVPDGILGKKTWRALTQHAVAQDEKK